MTRSDYRQIQTPWISSKILRYASYFQHSSRCLDIPMRHCHSCLINYLKKVLVGQTEWLDQIPCEPRLRIKITEYLDGLIGIVHNFVQSRLDHPSCFVVLTTSRLNLAVFSNRRYRTRTIVPNASGLTDFIAGSSIQTRIVPAAAIGAGNVTRTGRDAVVLLVKKIKTSTS